MDPTSYKYLYILRNIKIERTNQVWAMAITYLPMERGYLYFGGGDGCKKPMHSRLELVQHDGNRLGIVYSEANGT
jgi:hypothetical protein